MIKPALPLRHERGNYMKNPLEWALIVGLLMTCILIAEQVGL
jgi:hypothetical protein